MGRRRSKANASKPNAPASEAPNPVEPGGGKGSSSSDPTGSEKADPHQANASAETLTENADVLTGQTAGGKQILFPQLPSLSRIMSVVMLVFGILAVGALFYKLMVGFFVPLFLAALLVVIFRPIHQWIFAKIGRRRRIAAASTTLLILLIVLLPLGVLVSVATTQFTILLSQMNGSNLSAALDRVRSQLSLELPHAEHFRELDKIIDSLGVARTQDNDPNRNPSQEFVAKANDLQQATAIIEYLQSEVDGPVAAQPEAQIAIDALQSFEGVLRVAGEQASLASESTDASSLIQLNVLERFEQNAVVTAAATRRWMHTFLGGALRSQIRLIANPGEADFAALIRRARESLQPRFVRLTSATGSILVQGVFGLVILIVAVYFFLIDGPVMIRTLMRLSPMDDAYEHQLLMEFDRTSRAVVLASVLSAVVQGLLATIAFWLCGFDQIVLLMFLTSVMALVPFLGAASVWLPCALWLGLVEESWMPAILLAIYGAAIVSSIDNVIKVYVLHGRSQLHPLFALLSVIGGVSVFGPIGILVGPMVVVFLQTLLEILNHELQADQEGDELRTRPGDEAGETDLASA